VPAELRTLKKKRAPSRFRLIEGGEDALRDRREVSFSLKTLFANANQSAGTQACQTGDHKK